MAPKPSPEPALSASQVQPCAETPAGLSQPADPSGRAPATMDMTVQVESLLNLFEKAVSKRDRKKVMAFLDPDYREKEFEDYYQGDTAAFLNDFICGKTLDGAQTHCLPFAEIEEFERAGIEYRGDLVSAHYLVKTPTQAIRATLTAAPKRTVTYGIRGSRGFTQVE